MLTSLIYRIFMLAVSILYPAFTSYKALKRSDQKQCVSCLQYWVVISFFITVESVFDLFLSWLPFYYASKIMIILVILSTPGTKMAYKQLIHPKLKAHEKNIDNLIMQTRDSGYDVLMKYRDRGIRYASDLFLNTAVFGCALWDKQLSYKSRSHSEERGDEKNVRFRRAKQITTSTWHQQHPRGQSLDASMHNLQIDYSYEENLEEDYNPIHDYYDNNDDDESSDDDITKPSSITHTNYPRTRAAVKRDKQTLFIPTPSSNAKNARLRGLRQGKMSKMDDIEDSLADPNYVDTLNNRHLVDTHTTNVNGDS